MTEHKKHNAGRATIQANEALSPNGKLMTLADLPSPETKRWVIRRKAEVVAGVHGGLLSLDQACRRYQLFITEYWLWKKLLKDHGFAGLRITCIKKYRCPKGR